MKKTPFLFCERLFHMIHCFWGILVVLVPKEALFTNLSTLGKVVCGSKAYVMMISFFGLRSTTDDSANRRKVN